MKVYKELNHNGEILRGYHHKVNSSEVVVMLHGFTGNKTETSYMFRKVSNQLENHNIDSVRFDYIGSGESDGLFSSMTRYTLVEQIKQVMEYVTSFNYSKVYILGFSMGGALAFNFMDDADKLILLAPSVEFDIKIRNLRTLENGNYILDTFELNKDLFSSFKEEYYQLAKNYKNDVLIIQGSKDQAVRPETSIKLHETFPNSELVMIENASHVFNNYDHYKLLEDSIINFLKE